MGGPSESRSGRSSSMTAKPSTSGMSRSMTTTDGAHRAHEVGGLLAARAGVDRPAQRLQRAAHELERERVVVDHHDADPAPASRPGRASAGCRPGHGCEQVLPADRLDEVLRRAERESAAALAARH